MSNSTYKVSLNGTSPSKIIGVIDDFITLLIKEKKIKATMESKCVFNLSKTVKLLIPISNLPLSKSFNPVTGFLDVRLMEFQIQTQEYDEPIVIPGHFSEFRELMDGMLPVIYALAESKLPKPNIIQLAIESVKANLKQ